MSRLRRSQGPKRKKPIRARNTKRKSASFARAYGSAARVQFVASLPCSVPMCRRTPCENAHTATGGIGRKGDADTCIPLCTAHHRELHAVGQHTFARLHGLDLTRTAERIANAWRARHPMTAVGDILPAVLPEFPTTTTRQREAGD